MSSYLILVIEDEPATAEVLRDLLLQEGYRVVLAYRGREGLEKVRTLSPNLVILDLMLPDLDGFEVCKRIREHDARLPILILTGRTESEHQIRGLDLGADDYVQKGAEPETLLARVRALLRRTYEVRVRTLRFRDLIFDPEIQELRRGNRKVRLTEKESELMRVFMEHPRQVLPRERLYKEVWGYQMHMVSNVLDVYVRYLRRKLADLGSPPLIHTVRGVGYVLREPDEDEEPAGAEPSSGTGSDA